MSETEILPCLWCHIRPLKAGTEKHPSYHHPENDCVLAGIWVNPDKWNRRAQPSPSVREAAAAGNCIHGNVIEWQEGAGLFTRLWCQDCGAIRLDNTKHWKNGVAEGWLLPEHTPADGLPERVENYISRLRASLDGPMPTDRAIGISTCADELEALLRDKP